MGDNYINNSLLFKADKQIDVKIVMDHEMTNHNNYNVEPAILIATLKEGYIPNVDEYGSPIKSKKISINKKDLIDNPEIIVEIKTPRKNTEFYVTSTGVVLQNPINDGRVPNLWKAVDAVKTSDTSLKIFMSYNHEYPDFTDLVFDMYFSDKLKYLEMGFSDNPTYFSSTSFKPST